VIYVPDDGDDDDVACIDGSLVDVGDNKCFSLSCDTSTSWSVACRADERRSVYQITSMLYVTLKSAALRSYRQIHS